MVLRNKRARFQKSSSYLLVSISQRRQINANLRDVQSEQWTSKCSTIFNHTNNVIPFQLRHLEFNPIVRLIITK